MSADRHTATTPAAIAGAAEGAALSPARAVRVVIDNVRPCVNGGRFAVKRTAGESVTVVADAFADGHDQLTVLLLDRRAPERRRRREPGVPADRSARWRETEMTPTAPGLDEWTARFDVDSVGWHEYAILAWVDRFKTWRHDLEIKAAAALHLDVELLEGALLLREAASRLPAAAEDHRASLLEWADALSDEAPAGPRVKLALSEPLAMAMARHADRSRAAWSAVLPVWVDRERARFGAWYEIFPRSAGPDPNRSATFREAAELLPRLADLGFDVVYLPPIHPIGASFRKGRNNSLNPQPSDPGSPWAIGSAAGGHTAIEPGLGTMDDFVAFRQEAERLGLEVALDLAWQCSPDHPWVHEHPEWFRHRPDGTIQYAENPPKKYQDIYPFDFENDEWAALWRELLGVARFWIDRGVRIFRVDNPHTKPVRFWERLLTEIRVTDPDVLFLAEAFTRPAMMRTLAKIGFHQSYTYFTWRNTAADLTEYLLELSGPAAAYMRPNFFANTPDILNEYLQHGGPPAFRVRAVLAALLSPAWGIYSGYELCENTPLRPGSEEYLDSEKYAFRPRDWCAAEREPNGIAPFITRLNMIRRAHPALHWLRNLRFHHVDQPEMICFSKRSAADADTVLTVVNLDPHQPREATVWLDMPALGMDYRSQLVVTDELSGESYRWGQVNYVRLDPATAPAHIFTVTPSPIT